MQKKLAIRKMALITGFRCRMTINAEAIAQAAIAKKTTESKLTVRLGLSRMVQENWYKIVQSFERIKGNAHCFRERNPMLRPR